MGGRIPLAWLGLRKARGIRARNLSLALSSWSTHRRSALLWLLDDHSWKRRSAIPLKHVGKPEEIAEAIVFSFPIRRHSSRGASLPPLTVATGSRSEIENSFNRVAVGFRSDLNLGKVLEL